MGEGRGAMETPFPLTYIRSGRVFFVHEGVGESEDERKRVVR